MEGLQAAIEHALAGSSPLVIPLVFLGGEKSFGLGRTMLLGRFPVYGPFCPDFTTATAVNPGLTSRFARWPRNSVYGAKYS